MLRIISGVLLSISVILLIGGGLYFSYKMHFPQFNIIRLIKSLSTKSESNISPFKSMMVSLAARIGVGSIAGIALAIYIGGPGTVLWIWIISLITSVNTFCECYLGCKYQEKDDNNYKGGPSYYIEKGLKNKKLAILYSILIIIAYTFGFMTIQANTITVSIYNYCKLNPIIIATTIVIITLFSIIKGVNRITTITSKIVPIIGISYIFLSFIIITLNISEIPRIISIIIKDAFNINNSKIIILILISIKRSIFSTESGLGTTAIAASLTKTEYKISYCYTQILGVYFISFIICTSTALLILTSNYQAIFFNSLNGIELTQYALRYNLGSIGEIFLIISIIFLAYSTIIAGYYYGESCIKYLFSKKSHIHLFLLKTVVLLLLFGGSLINSTLLWGIVDILIEILAIINMYSLIKLRKEILFDYTLKK